MNNRRYLYKLQLAILFVLALPLACSTVKAVALSDTPVFVAGAEEGTRAVAAAAAGVALGVLEAFFPY